MWATKGGYALRTGRLLTRREYSSVGMNHAIGRVTYEDLYNVENLRAGYIMARNEERPSGSIPEGEVTARGLAKLAYKLKRQMYSPTPIARLTGPLAHSQISIPSTVDRVVQATFKGLVEPLFEPLFRDSSHGFRPKRGCHTALLELRYSWTSITWLLKIGFYPEFDTVGQELLLRGMDSVLQSKPFEDLMRKFLRAGYIQIHLREHGSSYQGSRISPLCNNIFLHTLDCYVEEELHPEPGYVPGSRRNHRHKMLPTSARQGGFGDYGELQTAIGHGLIGSRSTARDQDHELGGEPTRLKYIRYLDEIMVGVCDGSRRDAMDVRRAIERFVGGHLGLRIDPRISPLVNPRSETVKYLGTLLVYYGTDGGRGTIGPNRAQLIAPIHELLLRAVHRGCAKVNAVGLVRPCYDKALVGWNDAEIVKHTSNVIRGLVHYYSFVNRRASLWKVVSLYRKSCALTLARKHGMRSAEAAFEKWGPRLRMPALAR